MAFKNAWELVLAGLKSTPSEEIMESLFRRQLERSVQLKELMSLYNQDIVQRGDKRSYERLMKMLTAHLEQRRRQQNRDNLSGSRVRAATPARGDPKQGDCRQWCKTGSCSRGDACPWAHSEGARRRSKSPKPKKDTAKEAKDTKGKEGQKILFP